MNQQTIRQEDMWDRATRFIETPAARTTDPTTSHIAAEKHTASGQRRSNMQAASDLVRRMPGLTSWELSKHIDLGDDTYHELARRLPEAVKAAVVVKGTSRKCSVSGNLATTWWPV